MIVISNVKAAFLVLGDQLILDPNFLKAMITKVENNSETLIVCPVHNGKKGYPLLFRQELFGEIMNLNESQTIQDVIQAHIDKLLKVEAPEWSIMNTDTPEDKRVSDSN